MFKTFLETIQFEKENKVIDPKKQIWDDYIDKQLEHLVIEYQFDFESIAKLLIGLAGNDAKHKINKKRVQERWHYLHTKRKQESKKSQEQLRMDRVSKSVLKQEDPKLSMSLDDLIQQLPQQRKQKDYLKVSEEEITNASFLSYTGEMQQPTTFNVLKDSVRGIKDPKLRDSQMKQMELEFLKQLDKVGQDLDEDMITKPLLFRAQFRSNTDFIVEREPLTKEHSQKLLYHKIDLSNPMVPPTADDFQIDNYMSRFARQEEEKKQEEEVKVMQSETTETETDRDRDMEVKQQQEEFIKNFQMVEKGYKSIDEVVVNYENMRTQVKVQQIFEEKSENKQNFIEEKQENKPIFKDIQFSNEIEKIKQKQTQDNPKNQEEDEVQNAENDNEAEFLEQQRYNMKDSKQENKKQPANILNIPTNTVKNFESFDDLVEVEPQNQDKNEELQLNQEEERIQIVIQEMNRKKQEERQKDLMEVERLEKIFAQQKEERALLKAQKQQEEQRILQEKRNQEIKKKQEEALEVIIQRNEEEAKQKEQHNLFMIQEKEDQMQSLITNFEIKNSICLYDYDIAYLKNVSGIPDNMQKKFHDFNSYDISREGITSRYQILILPFIENMPFMCQIITFFLRNSFFKFAPTSEELDEGSPKKQQQQSHLPPYQRLSTHGFPFCLISLFIASYTKSIKDENNQYSSNYLKSQKVIYNDIETDRFKKCLFLLFDTHISRGKDILQKRLDTSLGEIMEKKLIEKVNKNFYKCNQDTKLSDFMVEHIKIMDQTERLFAKVQTFHSIYPTKSLDQPYSKQYAIIVVREYSEIFPKKIDNNTSVTMSQTDNVSMKENASITEVSQQQFQKPLDVLEKLLNEIDRKGLELLGMKTFYFNQETLQQYNNHINHMKIDVSKNKPVVVLVVSGIDIFQTIKKLIGSDNINYAKKMQINSLNSIFFQKNEDTITFSSDKIQSKKMLNYFFGGRLEKIKTFQRLQEINEEKQKFYMNKSTHQNPLFFINHQPIQQYVLILSCKIAANRYGQVLRFLHKQGCSIQQLKYFSNEDVDLMLKDSEFFLNCKQLGLDQFIFQDIQKESKYQNNNLILKISGQGIRSLRNKIITKILNYNSLLHPKKTQLVFFHESNSFFDNFFFKEKIIQKVKNDQFTYFKNFPHFVVIWPFLSQHKHKLIDIETLNKYNFEMLGLQIISLRPNFVENAKDSLRMLLFQNTNATKMFRKKPEFRNFCKKISEQLVGDSFLVGIYRLQDELIEKREKFFEQFYKEPFFANSNYNLSENSILNIGAQKKEYLREELPIECQELFFFESDMEIISNLCTHLQITLYDDTNFQNSFIFDIPNRGSTQILDTLMIVNDNILQTFNLSNIIKKCEGEKMQIVQALKINLNSNLIDSICDSYIRRFKIMDDLQDKDGRIQKLSFEIEQFREQSMHKKFWVLQLRKENAIFQGKQVLHEITLKIANFKNENFQINTDQEIEYQLKQGVYSSMSLRSLQQEMKAFLDMKQQYYNCMIPGDQINSQSDNRIFIICQINNFLKNIQLTELLMKIRDFKFRIDDFSVVQNFTDLQIEFIGEQFGPQFKPKNVNDDLPMYLMMDTYAKNVISLSDALGSMRIDDNGTYLSLINGSLFGKNKNFIIYTDKPDKIQNLRNFAFN